MAAYLVIVVGAHSPIARKWFVGGLIVVYTFELEAWDRVARLPSGPTDTHTALHRNPQPIRPLETLL